MLRGKTSAPVAAALRQKGVPFIFATGYGDRSDLPDEFADVPMVGKPYDGETVLDALTAALARPRQAARPEIGDADPFLDHDADLPSAGKKLAFRRCPHSYRGDAGMANFWTKKNPMMSLWLSGANAIMGKARNEALAQAKRTQTALGKQAASAAAKAWAPASKPSRPRRRK